MKFTEIEAKEPLNKLKNKFLPYQYDLNIYRGCSVGCKYCYAMKSHDYLEGQSFVDDIFVKTNIAEALEQKLSSPNWEGGRINIGGVCDSYQHAEKKYQLMRDVLKLMIKYKNPITISTKSDLITRDLDLIEELTHCTDFNIAMCITSCDEKLSKALEPGASLPIKRFEALKEISRTGATTGLHIMPILPFLADDETTLETLVRWAKEAEATYMLTGTLYLTGGIKKRYLSFVKEHYPHLYSEYLRLYPKGSASKEYKNKIHGFLGEMREKYGVNTYYNR